MKHVFFSFVVALSFLGGVGLADYLGLLTSKHVCACNCSCPESCDASCDCGCGCKTGCCFQ